MTIKLGKDQPPFTKGRQRKGVVIMNREEILKQAQAENNGKDVADLDAQHKGAYAAYFVGIILIVLVNLVEGFVFGRASYGGTMAVFAMGFTAFLIKYLALRKKHELFVAIAYGGFTLMWLVLWILQLCGVIG